MEVIVCSFLFAYFQPFYRRNMAKETKTGSIC
jgi:hypothetical protein